jgi:prepilin peptidase CpaA
MILITPIMTLTVLIVLLLSCISDVRALRIPNWHSLVLIGCFFPAWLAAPQFFDGIGAHLGAMGIMLVVTYIMFTFGMMGGGDSKLGTALGLWVGMKGLLPFILYMSFAGGVLAVVSLIISKRKPFKKPVSGGWIEQAQAGKNSIPYGIAISLGAALALLQSGFVHNQLNEVLTTIH